MTPNIKIKMCDYLKINDAVPIMYNEDKTFEFFRACVNNNLEVVNNLLNDIDVNVNTYNIMGETAFYIACKKGFIDIVKLLSYDIRVDVNKTNEDGKTPFYIV